MTVDVDAYLTRIGLDDVAVDAPTLQRLQRAHLSTVPFENLSIVRGEHVPTDAASSIDKIVRRRRGGWCFEVNGAFAELLRALGFGVRLLGAAVLLDGPSRVIEHLALEVDADGDQWLVDVGFGDTFVDPLRLNVAGGQDGGNGVYEFIRSAEGTTLTRLDDHGVPAPEYRFKRVALELDDFTAISNSMQVDPDKRWRSHPFATRLLDGGPDRVTLTRDRLKFVTGGRTEERPVGPDRWDDELSRWFGPAMLH